MTNETEETADQTSQEKKTSARLGKPAADVNDPNTYSKMTQQVGSPVDGLLARGPMPVQVTPVSSKPVQPLQSDEEKEK